MQVRTTTEAYKNQSWKIAELRPEHADAFTATGILPPNIELLEHDLPTIDGITPIKGPLKIFEAASDPNRTIAIIPGLAGGNHIYSAPDTGSTFEYLIPGLKPFFGDGVETLYKAIKDWCDPDRTGVSKPVIETTQAVLQGLKTLLDRLPNLPPIVTAYSETIGFVLKIADKVCLVYLTLAESDPAKDRIEEIKQ
jgi:hypothetical protein